MLTRTRTWKMPTKKKKKKTRFPKTTLISPKELPIKTLIGALLTSGFSLRMLREREGEEETRARGEVRTPICDWKD